MNTKQELINRLTESNNEETKANRVHKAVADWLKTEAGKQLNGWTQKRAVKYFFEMWGWSIRFGVVCGDQNYLYVWGGDSGYTQQEPVRMFLGYGKDMASLNVEVFEDRNCCYGSAAEARIAARTALTASDNEPWLNHVAMRIDVYKQAKEALEKVMGECGPGNEAYYHIKELSGWVDKR